MPFSQDTLHGVREAAELLIPAARALKNENLSKQLQKSSRSLAASAGEASGHSNIGQAREDLKQLSELLASYVKKNPQSDWAVFHCPMKKAEWIQKAGTEMQNPYFGKEMLTCGTKVE